MFNASHDVSTDVLRDVGENSEPVLGIYYKYHLRLPIKISTNT